MNPSISTPKLAYLLGRATGIISSVAEVLPEGKAKSLLWAARDNILAAANELIRSDNDETLDGQWPISS